MANYYFTRLKCSNPEMFKAIAKELGHVQIANEAWWHDTEFSVYTRGRPPHDEFVKIVKQFPDDLITCHYSGCYDDYTGVQIVEHKAGQYNEFSFEPSYFHMPYGHYKFLDWNGIYDKAEAFFRRLDTIETDKEGNLFINWFDEEVTYKFEQDATNGKKYRIEATKVDWMIKCRVFECRRW